MEQQQRIEVPAEASAKLQELYADLTAAYLAQHTFEDLQRQILGVPDEKGWQLNDDATAFVKVHERVIVPESFYRPSAPVAPVVVSGSRTNDPLWKEGSYTVPAPSQKDFCCDPGDAH